VQKTLPKTRMNVLVLGMLAPAPLQWIRTPVQGRSERTLARILDATERLLNARTFEQLTVQDIVREAEASVGSFYARFESKDALLNALHERYVAESIPTTERALDPALWRGIPLLVLVEQTVAFLVDQTWQNRGLKRALVIAVAKGEPGFRERSSGLAGLVVDQLAALFVARGDALGGKDARAAADFVHRLVFSFLDQMVSFAPDDPIARPRAPDVLARELVHAVYAYLVTPAPHASGET
jgi:AcrR family transcriptional regulator